MSNIKAVLFDYGGVLNPEQSVHGGIERLFSTALGIPVGFEQIADIHQSLMTGELNKDSAIAALNQRFPEKIKELDEKMWQCDPSYFVKATELYEYCQTLRLRGIKTGIVSNVYSTQYQLLYDLGLYEGFSPVVLSCQVGITKPDPAIYTQALEALSLLPDEVIFVDDLAKNTSAAADLGMHTICSSDQLDIIEKIEKML